jgi:hypothetical protein
MAMAQSTAAQVTCLCGIRKDAPVGGFTLRAGGWPFAKLMLDGTDLCLGPAPIPIVALIVASSAVGVVVGIWYLGLVALFVAGIAFVGTPRVRWPIATLRVQQTRVNGIARALKFESPNSADPLWVWQLPLDAVVAGLTTRGARVLED